MKKFIFLTAEGYTYQPDSESSVPDIENLQVVGFGEGKTIDDAVLNMVREYPYLKDTNFDDLIGMELKDGQSKTLCLSDYKK
ncbi:MAG: hypothetical protein ACE5EB_07135 [Thermodesulfobacteriota bacterium]